MKFTYLLAACLPCALTFVLSTTVTPLRAQDAGAQFAMPQCGKLPITIQMHGTAVIGDRIYIFGGLDAKGWSDKVHSAPLLPNARVGAWREEKHLPDRRCYLVNCLEVVNDYVYLVGGLTSAQIDGKESALTRKNNVLYTKVLPGGILDDWKESVAMPPPAISLGASCSTDKFLLLTGGSAPPSIVSSNVLIADLGGTGAPENWRVAGKMPASLWFHGAAILDSKIYLWGGLPTRCLLYTSPSPRDRQKSRMPSSA